MQLQTISYELSLLTIISHTMLSCIFTTLHMQAVYMLYQMNIATVFIHMKA